MTEATAAAAPVFAWSWEWSDAEFRAALGATARHSRHAWVRWLFQSAFILVAVLSVLVVLRDVHEERTAAALSQLPWTLILLFWLVFLYAWYPRTTTRRARKLQAGPLRLEIVRSNCRRFSPIGHLMPGCYPQA